MASYTANAVGSASMAVPSKVRKNDTLTFNITNTDVSTKYKGTIMSYTFPCDCTVKIEAKGARGGYGNLYTYGLTDASRSGSGAYVYGTFTFAKGDQLLILVGQAGTDAMTSSGSTQDGATGAGGGGTFIVKRTATGSTFTGNSINGSDSYNGWIVSPLLIAAGGNGTRDNGYSGTGTIYGGLHTTGSQPSYSSSRTGGGFATAYGTNNSNSSSYGYGLSFLNGGLGSQYYYTRRNITSHAGFGGGGCNGDDGDGGGAGGYYGGLAGKSACSFIASEATNSGGASDNNAGEGIVVFTFLKVKGATARVKVGGTYRTSEAVYVKRNGVWVEAEGLYVKSGGAWHEST